MVRIFERSRVLGICCLAVAISTFLSVYICFRWYPKISSFCLFAFIIILLNLSITIYLASCFYKQQMRLRRAKLIKESQIFNLYLSVADDENEVLMYFSPFGILLGDRMVPFDERKEKLLGMELMDEETIITYGKEKNKKTLRLPKLTQQGDDLKELTEKLRYETGVTLRLTSW